MHAVKEFAKISVAAILVFGIVWAAAQNHASAHCDLTLIDYRMFI